ncbi:transposase, partial [bacterium]|nr:transposase [bacterium]
SLMEDTTAQSVVFNGLFGKPLLASFDQPDSSSDGGAILLKACDQKLGLIDAISACLRDDRQQGKVSHTKPPQHQRTFN